MQPPPDIAELRARVAALGDAIAAARNAIAPLKTTPWTDGLWVTGDGERWRFHFRRQRRDLPRAS